ncbi:FemAB family XrtA/PEP-CTERM system-associated protein [Sphingobium phenoxybenzoativorans]|uniref:FemAB family XrtA/PEP-CTERM system-associated protein n=1 Tax=Sphingobium phenoxybenzoativorans TaxID=1592790 RepID=UPI000872F298|nr:FemAB family XrtA/PEP-CTERM system-associated protein [Sphingobium phenoxybenzoativorans]
MNASFDPAAVSVEEIRLTDRAAVAEVEAWLKTRPESTPFHRPAWIAAVARANGQRAILLVARDVVGGIAGVLPLVLIRSALFGRALVSSGFAVDGGILALNPRAEAALADTCWRLAEAHGCSTAELRGGPAPEGWTVKADAYLGFSKPLEADDEAQLLSIPRKHRAEVRRGIANDLTFEMGSDRRLRDIHYRLYCESVHRLGTPVFPRALFDEVLDAFGPDADIALVSKDGTPLSSVLSLYHGDAVMPYWQGAALAARAERSNEYLYFRLMTSARERGCRIFDFGRSKVGTGPAAWKKTWGFEGVPLSYALRAADGQALRDVNPLSPQYRRKVEMWKKLPLPVANLVGPWLARGLG